MADVATLTLRADISELQRKLRSIPDDASGSAKQMAVALERSFKQATAASIAAAKASGAAQASAARETERAVAKLAEYAAAGAVAPLDAFVADPETGYPAEEMADFFPAAIDTNRFAQVVSACLRAPRRHALLQKHPLAHPPASSLSLSV